MQIAARGFFCLKDWQKLWTPLEQTRGHNEQSI